MPSEPIIKRDPSRAEVELVLQHGRRFIPALLPMDIQRMEPGMCFDASAIQSLKSDGKYGYVEGIALDPDNHDKWMIHAWMTDGTHAFDPTWAATGPDGRLQPVPTMYIGIEMEIVMVCGFMMATEYQGVIPNRWRNERLANRAILSKKL